MNPEIDEQEGRFEELDDDVDRATDAVVREDSPEVRKALARLVKERDAAWRKLRDLRETRDRTASPYVMKRLDTMRDALTTEPFDVAAANTALRACISKIEISPDEGWMDLHWAHGGVSENIRFHTQRIVRRMFANDDSGHRDHGDGAADATEEKGRD